MRVQVELSWGWL